MANSGYAKTFKWGKAISEALEKESAETQKSQVVLVLDALFKAYPRMREAIKTKRGWENKD
jgi:hypothetical protein